MSSYEVNKVNVGIFPAGSANLGRYRAVRLVAEALEKPEAGGQCFGICQADTNLDGEVVAVQVSGIGEIECAATIATGALVTVDTDGKASAAATTDQYILGKVLQAGVAGKIVPIKLILDQQVNGPNP